jgi:hypothetical protein
MNVLMKTEDNGKDVVILVEWFWLRIIWILFCLSLLLENIFYSINDVYLLYD